MRKTKKSTETSEWQVMVDAAKRGLQDQGFSISRVPGRGLSNVWTVDRNGKSQTASIRTTRNRWIAFPPLENGTKWKTLDDVDLVVVSAVDRQDDPENVEIYIFPATEVRKRFSAAYGARTRAGQTIRDDFGMWIGLDADKRDIPSSVGSGLAQTTKPVAVFAMESLTRLPHQALSKPEARDTAPSGETAPEFTTIAGVMAWARKRVAEIAGVGTDAVKLDLKIEY